MLYNGFPITQPSADTTSQEGAFHMPSVFGLTSERWAEIELFLAERAQESHTKVEGGVEFDLEKLLTQNGFEAQSLQEIAAASFILAKLIERLEQYARRQEGLLSLARRMGVQSGGSAAPKKKKK